MSANRPGKKTFKQQIFDIIGNYMDPTLLVLVFILLLFGLVMIYSASSYEANMDFGDSNFYLKKQLIASGLGIIIMGIVGRYLPYKAILRRYQGGLLYIGIATVIMFLLFVPGLKYSANGATRWIRIPVVGFTFQPAELVKVCVILFEATYLSKYFKSLGKNLPLKVWALNFLKAMAMPAYCAFLVLVISRNMSSAIIVFMIGFVMVFIASANTKAYILMALVVVLMVGLLVFYLSKQNINQEGLNYRFVRIMAWLDPQAYADDEGYQTVQALYAIGSGGVFGKGLGQSVQKMDFIPEAQNDMIFSIICEELGLFGGVFLMIVFFLLIARCAYIIQRTRDMYGAFLVSGVMAHIAVQVVLNIAVVTNTIPNTGISLPFISYGGSSVVFLLAEIGLVLSVARENERNIEKELSEEEE